MKLSIAIQSHPDRAALAAALAAEVGGDVVVDPDPGSPARSPWRTYRRCLEETPRTATHRLVLQDDTLVCPRFAVAARNALTARPDPAVTFYVGGNARLLAQRVMHAAHTGQSWVSLPRFSWFPAVAVAWPVRLIAPLLEYVDQQPWAQTHRADDEIIGRFLRHHGETPYATVPSLVDHPDDVPSLIGTRHRGGLNPARVVVCWVGECPADEIDWSV